MKYYESSTVVGVKKLFVPGGDIFGCGNGSYCEGVKCEECIKFNGHKREWLEYVLYNDLTQLREPFGYLPKFVQEKLKKAYDDGFKIRFMSYDGNFINVVNERWSEGFIYRIAPGQDYPKKEDNTKCPECGKCKLCGK